MQELVFSTMPTFHQLWESCMERHLTSSFADMQRLLSQYGLTNMSQLIDTCVGGGTFGLELLLRGYKLTTADGNAGMLDLFRKKLKEHGVAHDPMLVQWAELPHVLGEKRFDAAICCGNSLIYAGGHWNHDGEVVREESLAGILETLRIFRSLLAPGGVLVVDKPPDDEQPTEELVARLCVAEREMYDVFFSVRFDGERRTAQILLRNQVTGQESGTPNVAYRLRDDELTALFHQAGFSTVERMAQGANSHFPLWVAKS